MKKANAKVNSRRGLWKGSIAFGLVNIPIYLESAVQEKKIHFNLIDKRDKAPIGYRQFNKRTGKEIPRSAIVKGYQYEKGEYVLMTDDDFKKTGVKGTSSIEIQDFVDLHEIDLMLFEKPYYVVPQKGGEKAYALLREVLRKRERAAIAKIVLHTVQHLVCLMVRGDYLILEILRFAHEVIDVEEAHFLERAPKAHAVSAREISVAEQLGEGMTSHWKPEKYHDTYHDDLLKLIKARVKRGRTTHVEKVETEDSVENSDNIIDLTALLKKSLTDKRKRRSV